MGSPQVDVCTAAANKVAFCHFDREDAEWILSLLPQNAVNAHLTRHDDALAGGITSKASTQLDAECLPVAKEPEPESQPEPQPEPEPQPTPETAPVQQQESANQAEAS